MVAFRQGETCHVFAVRQRIRPDAAAVVLALHRAGINVEILSGDREPAVRRGNLVARRGASDFENFVVVAFCRHQFTLTKCFRASCEWITDDTDFAD